MKPLNDGGPAFPGFAHTEGHGSYRINTQGEWEAHEPGMTLRDWFAGMALQGFFACRHESMSCSEGNKNLVARHCYIYADAMIAARGKEDA